MSTIDPNVDILIVDDSASNLNVLVDVCSDAGYHVRPASNGEVALRCVQEKLPAIILLDVMMPDPDGFEVCRILKSDERTRSIPIIFISALEDEHKRVKGFQMGGVDYITKPFYSEEVLARVRAHLSLHLLQLDLEEKNKALEAEIIQRTRVEEALRTSEEKFRAIFEQNSSAIAIIEPDTTISMVNHAYCQVSGYTKEEAVGMSWTRQIPPGDLERLKEYNRRRLINPKDAPDNYEFNFYHKNGSIRYGIMSVSYIQSAQKIITSFVDITDRRNAEAEREKLINELKTALADVKTLSGLLPICASCKKIRDDNGYWQQVENYIQKHSNAEFTHGICPDCFEKYDASFLKNKPTGKTQT